MPDPFSLARSLQAGCGVVALGLIVASVAGLAPLASSGLSLGLLAAGTLAGGVVLCRPGALGRDDTRAARLAAEAAAGPLPLLGRLTLLAGVLATVITVALALWFPVGAYDAIGYRLPAVAQWLDAGGWSWVPGDDPLRNGYPLGLELIEAVLFAGFGTPALVDAVSSLFVVAGALSLGGLVRQLGARPGAGKLAAGLFLLVPMHLLNAPSGYADAAFAGAMACLLVAAARCEIDDERGWVDLGVSAAWTMALKPHGVAYAGLIVAVVVLRAGSREGAARALRHAGWVALCALPGLSFLVRNVVRTHNPVYPLEVKLAGHVLLPGDASLDGILTPDFNVPGVLAALPTWLRPLTVWLQPFGPARAYDDRLAGLGYAFVLIALPAWAWFWARTFVRSRAGGQNANARAVRLLGTLSATCWLLQPFSFWPRFTSWLWGAGAVAVALLLSGLVDAGRVRAALLLGVLTLLLALPEAAYALAHVKELARLGSAAWSAPPREVLSRMAGIDPSFVERVLVGARAVCRTPWRLGTDDANIDGVVAQLSPRPRMHVIDSQPLSRALADAAAHGCSSLIVIGDNPIAHEAQPAWTGPHARLRAIGDVSVFSTALMPR